MASARAASAALVAPGSPSVARAARTVATMRSYAPASVRSCSTRSARSRSASAASRSSAPAASGSALRAPILAAMASRAQPRAPATADALPRRG